MQVECRQRSGARGFVPEADRSWVTLARMLG
jgi:hypothetical protein